ncbi:MAG TPA: 3-oxoacid CoA-transferase subunit A [Acidiphilium sp.]|nr:MAG: 3-oxoadipate CoA-transferase [Acidiphilium sp. 21-60-14]OYV92251.1 MAG: 3-oxoadipate CoA-transferase [Acidiphilium sp. 37-60-79]OZB40572.1 MAG: 3-oxoadipate CoA-transferase [Acidiphilium sp. 34-60-192]HQT87379.1 3-oxoacid CoA-transferase subunit A [Acidiphilium sp.]HQU24605.1 3-oxoacid CoA-transferase subunit A [Acidiphilium sp.]
MIDKFVPSLEAALADIADGATIMVGGFGAIGQPHRLVDALSGRGLRNLTIIANNAGGDFGGLPALIAEGSIRKVICSYPRAPTKTAFDALYATGDIDLELVPQGTLAERIRAAGAGIPAFFTPTGADTELAAGKETRLIQNRLCVLETALSADFALIEAWSADRWGNLTYRATGRNFNPIMATAATITIAQIHQRVEIGSLDPENIVTPGLYVQRLFLAD